MEGSSGVKSISGIGNGSVKTLMRVSAWHVRGRREEAAVGSRAKGRGGRVVGPRPKGDGTVFRYTTNVREALWELQNDFQ